MGTHTKLFFKDKPVIGVDISATGAKVMAINQKQMTVLGYGSIDLDPQKLQASLLKDDPYLGEALIRLFKNKITGHIHNNHAVVSVPTNRTYSRTMTLPVSAEQNLSEAVQLEAEQYIPIPTSELYIDYEIIERDKTNITVLVAAVPKRIVEAIITACNKSGLEVVMVEPGISAAARLIRLTEEGNLPSLIIDVSAGSTDIALLDSVVRVNGGVSVGAHTFTLRIADKLKISLEEAHQLKVHSGLDVGPYQAKIRSAIEPSLNQIVAESRKIMRYYAERIGSETKIEQVLIVGGGSNMPGIGEFITNALLMPARVGNPWQTVSFGKLTAPSRQFKPRFVTAAGLAIVPPKEIWL